MEEKSISEKFVTCFESHLPDVELRQVNCSLWYVRVWAVLNLAVPLMKNFFLFFCLNSWLCKLYKPALVCDFAGKADSVLAICEGCQSCHFFSDMFPILLSKCRCYWGQRVAQWLDQRAGDKWDSAQHSHENWSLCCLGPLARWDQKKSWCLNV